MTMKLRIRGRGDTLRNSCLRAACRRLPELPERVLTGWGARLTEACAVPPTRVSRRQLRSPGRRRRGLRCGGGLGGVFPEVIGDFRTPARFSDCVSHHRRHGEVRVVNDGIEIRHLLAELGCRFRPGILRCSCRDLLCLACLTCQDFGPDLPHGLLSNRARVVLGGAIILGAPRFGSDFEVRRPGRQCLRRVPPPCACPGSVAGRGWFAHRVVTALRVNGTAFTVHGLSLRRRC